MIQINQSEVVKNKRTILKSEMSTQSRSRSRSTKVRKVIQQSLKTQEFIKGEKVIAMFGKNNKWFEAKILNQNVNETYNIIFNKDN